MADGLGARFESKLDHTIVVSMGTGTSFVMCNGDEMRHIGGIGVGGGTLQGLARIMLNTGDIKQVATLAKQGNMRNIDLTIGDISAQPLPGLPMDTIASNFARAQTDASKEDIAAGLIRMVLQSIGSAAWLASLGSDIRDFVLIGNLSLLPSARKCSLPWRNYTASVSTFPSIRNIALPSVPLWITRLTEPNNE